MRTRANVAIPLLLTAVALGACATYGGPPPEGYVATSTAIVVAPPDLPVYEQAACPGDGYLWTPGYWAWDGAYYWVPGTWVEPPQPGYLWTPGYWSWGGGAYAFHEGYWSEHVGFYGGVAYGHGYTGQGYQGGRWDNGRFFYNQSVNNVNVTVVHNVYNTTVVNNTTIVNNTVTRVSYNGGSGGVTARPTADEEAVARARHFAPVSAQTEHVRLARSNPQLRASTNQGRPPIAATSRAGALNEPGVVAASEAGTVHNSPDANRGPRPNTVVHPNDLPQIEHSAPNTGNPNLDRKYQQDQEKLVAQQNQDRVQLQKKQDQEHQQLAQQHADAGKMQQLEQRHQQQTQTLAAKHDKQAQNLKAHQPPPPKQ